MKHYCRAYVTVQAVKTGGSTLKFIYLLTLYCTDTVARHSPPSLTEIELIRQTDRQTDRQIDRQTGRTQMNRYFVHYLFVTRRWICYIQLWKAVQPYIKTYATKHEVDIGVPLPSATISGFGDRVPSLYNTFPLTSLHPRAPIKSCSGISE